MSALLSMKPVIPNTVMAPAIALSGGVPTASGTSRLASDVVSAASGDRKAFERLVAGTQRLVTSIALSIVRNVATSEDVAQEVYLEVWRDLRLLRNPQSFLPWLRELTRHRAYDSVRKRGRGETLGAAWRRTHEGAVEAGALDRALSKEDELVLTESLEGLGDDDRSLLTLYYREEQSVMQVATLLEVTESAVKKRLERARLKLREGVEARLADLAIQSAPGAAFTGMVVLALGSVVPSTAAAATVGSFAANSKAGKALISALALPIVAIYTAAGAVFGATMYVAARIRLRKYGVSLTREQAGSLIRSHFAVGALFALTMLAMHQFDRWEWAREHYFGALVFTAVCFATLPFQRRISQKIVKVLGPVGGQTKLVTGLERQERPPYVLLGGLLLMAIALFVLSFR